MKHITKIILSAIFIAMSVISCSEDKLDNSTSNGEKVITLTGGYGDDSRLSFNNSEYKYYWNDDDEITLWSNNGESVNIQLTSGAGTKTGVFSGRISETFSPAYITYAKGTGETVNNGTNSVNLSRIDPIAFSTGLISLPDLSYGTVSISPNGKFTFQLNHSVTFVYLKNVSVNGTAVSQVNVTTNTGSLSVDKNGALTPSNLSAVTATVNVGTIIPVLPTNFSVTTTDNSTVIVPATNLAAGSFYTIDKNVSTTKALTFAASPTAGGSVSSDSQDIVVGEAATAVTATANAGYIFDGWYLGSVKLGASGTDANGNSYTVSDNVLTITDAQAAADYVAKFITACDILNASTLTNGSLVNMPVAVGETYRVNLQDGSGFSYYCDITITGADSFSGIFSGTAVTFTSFAGITVSNGKLTVVPNTTDTDTSCSSMSSLCNSELHESTMHARCPATCGLSKNTLISVSAINGNCGKTYSEAQTQYIISYSAENGVVSAASQSVIKGNRVSAVTATANNGYTFKGWYSNGTKLGASGTDANGNAYTVSGTVLTITNAQSSASYVAQFAAIIPEACTYLYSSSLTSGALNNMSVVVDETYKAEFQDGSGYTYYLNITITGTNSYSIDFNDNSGVKPTSFNGITVSNGKLTIVPNTTDVENGCGSMQSLCNNEQYAIRMHAGCVGTCGLGKNTLISVSAVNGNCTQKYASTQSTYTITYDGQGGSTPNPNPVTAVKGNAITLGYTSRSGYTFAGWFTAATGGSFLGGIGESYTPNADVTIYAHWRSSVTDYTLSFNLDGGTAESGHSYTSRSFPAGQQVSNLGSPVRDGYTFAGWTSNVSVNATSATSGATTSLGSSSYFWMPSSNVTLTANWTKITDYTLSFNLNGGTAESGHSYANRNIAVGQQVSNLGNPVRSGYTFAGWTSSVSVNTLSATTGAATSFGAGAYFWMPSSNVTLTANWTAEDNACTYVNSCTLVGGQIQNLRVFVGQTYTLKFTGYLGKTYSWDITITGANSFTQGSNDNTTIKIVSISGGYLTVRNSGDIYYTCASTSNLCTNSIYKILYQNECPTTCGYGAGGITIQSIATNGCTKTF